jgi:hypothetical protein
MHECVTCAYFDAIIPMVSYDLRYQALRNHSICHETRSDNQLIHTPFFEMLRHFFFVYIFFNGLWPSIIIFLVKVAILGYMGILRIVGQSQAKTYNLAAAITNLRGNCKPQATWILWIILGAAPPKLATPHIWMVKLMGKIHGFSYHFPEKQTHGSFTNDSMIHPGLTTSFLTFALWTLWWIWKVLIVNQRTCDLASICAWFPHLGGPIQLPFWGTFWAWHMDVNCATFSMSSSVSCNML